MRKESILSVAFALTVPTMGLAAGTPEDIYHGALHHHRPPIHRRIGQMQAMPPKQATMFSSTVAVPHSVYEREGLTRNPSDCAVYSCIGNN
jgi:hypothetical protein